MIRQIKYFQTVIRCNSFTEAAEECHISQSAISQQIQALERELGVKLLERQNRKFSLTPAGEYFYKKSLVLLSDFERICHETQRIEHQDDAELSIGYLNNYGGQEVQMAVARFSEKYPDVVIHLTRGNHEDLYRELISGNADLVFNDQRRAFADNYVNFTLGNRNCFIEIASRNPVSNLEHVTAEELKNTPCILVSSEKQRNEEQKYYQDIIGFQGDFLFAENLEEARLMVVRNQGFLPIEGDTPIPQFESTITRIPLYRNGKHMERSYLAFWKSDNSGYYVEEFADILKSLFKQC